MSLVKIKQERQKLSASKKKQQRAFVAQVVAENLSPKEAVERASVFPFSGESKVLYWPKL